MAVPETSSKSAQLATHANKHLRNLIRLVVAFALAASGLVGAGQSASAAEVGSVGPSYLGTTQPSAPAAQKPQSKLWFAHNTWWGALWDTDSNDFHVFRYARGANSWVDTGSLLEGRTRAEMDVLFTNGRLYVVSAGIGATSPNLEFSRYTYNAAGGGTWRRDTGFPVTLATERAYSPVIARDSKGLLWVTYTQGTRVMITHSRAGADANWVTPYQLPVPDGAATVSLDPIRDPNAISSDISSVVSFDGNKIGVLWSNQVTMKMYWASHSDGAGDRTWSLDTAYDQPEGADDHISLKAVAGTANGKVYAVAKTSKNAAADPLINLLVLGQNSEWTSTVFARVADDLTRATLLIDSQNRELYVFASGPCCAGGKIFYKKTSMANPDFSPGQGSVFMESDRHLKLNNPTSTKQTVNAASGVMVMASDDSTRSYFYNKMTVAGKPPVVPPPTPPPARDLFADNFTSGGLKAGRWVSQVRGNGSARVVRGAIRRTNAGVILTSTNRRGSSASIWRSVGTAQDTLEVAWDARVVGRGQKGQLVTLMKLYDASGRRVLSLNRRSGSGRLSLTDTTGTTSLGRHLRVGKVARLRVRVAQNAAGRDTWSLRLNGGARAARSTANLGQLDVRSFRLGDDAVRRSMSYRVDNVAVRQ